MTIYRAYGHVDRATAREGAPLRVVMATEGRKADGIDLRMSGAGLDRFRANPVLGYGHRYYGRDNLPIGRVNPASITVDGPSALADLEFDQGDEFARTVERKMRDGYLNAVSIGFEVLAWENDNARSGVATSWELSELSVVPVPMDASATVQAGRAGDTPDEQFIRWLLEQWRREMPPPSLRPDAAPEHTPAVPAGVHTTAARTLLAAFNPEGIA